MLYSDTMSLSRIMALAVAISCFLICAAGFAVPFLMHAGREEVSLLLWNSLAPLCHQNQDRSLYIFGWQMGLCARCTAIFLFASVAALLRIIKPNLGLGRRALYLLALGCMAPMLVEVIFTLVFQIDFDIKIRILTGSLHGGGAAILVIQLAGDVWSYFKKTLKHTGGNHEQE